VSVFDVAPDCGRPHLWVFADGNTLPGVSDTHLPRNRPTVPTCEVVGVFPEGSNIPAPTIHGLDDPTTKIDMGQFGEIAKPGERLKVLSGAALFILGAPEDEKIHWEDAPHAARALVMMSRSV
jgi:hypothetical protein